MMFSSAASVRVKLTRLIIKVGRTLCLAVISFLDSIQVLHLFARVKLTRLIIKVGRTLSLAIHLS